MTRYKDPTDWTTDEIMTVIPKVLDDPQALDGCLRLLAVRDPDKAQQVIDHIEAGLWLAEQLNKP